jgi:hypothetical protein
MTRYKATPEGNIPFTAEEEAEFDQMVVNAKAAEPARKSVSARGERDKLLSECDWIVIKAKETSTNVPAAWKTYRQELRDITTQEGFPNTITWPTKPN